MRTQSGWSDACILNISSRGLLVYSAGAAELGSFVEVRRGGQLVVARVVWRTNQRIGLCSTDPIHVDDLISTDVAAAVVRSTRAFTPERRKIPRDGNSSRSRGRAAEFIATVLIGAILAGSCAVGVSRALSKPLSQVRSALVPR